MRRRAVSRRAAVRLAAAALLFALVLPLAGWSNGPAKGDGFGAHDWVLYQADRVARAGGYGWLVWSEAQPRTDDPDTVLHDYRHHVYDVWGEPYGDAPARVQTLYAEAVTELRRGDERAASATFGLLAHYYADVCNPLHTDQSAEEDDMHGRYETAAQKYVDHAGEHAEWVVPDGIARVNDAAAETRNAAAAAHGSYARLVSGYAAHGMDADVVGITRTSLDRAANGLADLIASAAMDARVAPPVASSGAVTSAVPASRMPSAVPATAPAVAATVTAATATATPEATPSAASSAPAAASTGAATAAQADRTSAKRASVPVRTSALLLLPAAAAALAVVLAAVGYAARRGKR